jgi:hypothetical protein
MSDPPTGLCIVRVGPNGANPLITVTVTADVLGKSEHKRDFADPYAALACVAEFLIDSVGRLQDRKR